MTSRYFFTSMTRITDLPERDFGVEALNRKSWSTGDYVVAEVIATSSGQWVELDNGRMIEVAEGDLVIGALGRRHATLEATGTWEAVGEDGRMSLLTAAGLMGKCTSISPRIPSLTGVLYRGHVLARDCKLAMDDFVAAVEADGAEGARREERVRAGRPRAGSELSPGLPPPRASAPASHGARRGR